MVSGPFIHKFATEAAHYVYDVNSNQILRVDEVVFAVIDLLDELSTEEIMDRFDARFPRSQIQEALANLANARSKGLFSNSRPTAMAYPRTQSEIARTLDSELNQMVLNLTEACNLRCSYCVYSGDYPEERSHTTRKMSPETARAAVDYFLAHSTEAETRQISFYGGEPLLQFSLMREVIAYVHAQGASDMRFQVTTNGTLLSPETCRYLAENDVALLISVDGPMEVHDTWRQFANGTGSFTKLSTHVHHLAETYPDYFARQVGFDCTVADPGQLDRIFEFFATEEPYRRFAAVANFVRAVDIRLATSPTERAGEWPARLVEMLLSENGEVKSPAFTFLNALVGKPFRRIHQRRTQPLGDTLYPNGICLPGKKRLFVTNDGDFRPCEKTISQLKLGDVHQGIRAETVSNLIDQYSAISQEDCFQCWACRLCDMCYTSAQDPAGLSLERKRFFCKGMRQTLDHSLKLYSQAREQKPDAFKPLGARRG